LGHYSKKTAFIIPRICWNRSQSRLLHRLQFSYWWYFQWSFSSFKNAQL